MRKLLVVLRWFWHCSYRGCKSNCLRTYWQKLITRAHPVHFVSSIEGRLACEPEQKEWDFIERNLHSAWIFLFLNKFWNTQWKRYLVSIEIISAEDIFRSVQVQRSVNTYSPHCLVCLCSSYVSCASSVFSLSSFSSLNQHQNQTAEIYQISFNVLKTHSYTCFLFVLFLAFDFCRFCVVIHGFFIPATTANDLRRWC